MSEENTKYLTGEELTKRWRIKPFDLCRLVETNGDDFFGIFFYPDNPKDPLILTTEEILTAFFPIEKTIKAFEEKHPEYKPHDSPYKAKDGETPPYLIKDEEKNPNYSHELFIAVDAWLKICGPGSDQKSMAAKVKTLRQRILRYLEKKYPELGKDARDRIATVANPDRNKRG